MRYAKRRKAWVGVALFGVVVALAGLSASDEDPRLPGWNVRYERHHLRHAPLGWMPDHLEIGPAMQAVPQELADLMLALGAEPAYPPLEEADVRRILATYYVVPSEEWSGSVGLAADRVALVGLADGSKFHVVQRTTGVAALVYPDGGVVYLTRDLERFVSTPGAR